MIKSSNSLFGNFFSVVVKKSFRNARLWIDSETTRPQKDPLLDKSDISLSVIRKWSKFQFFNLPWGSSSLFITTLWGEGVKGVEEVEGWRGGKGVGRFWNHMLLVGGGREGDQLSLTEKVL